MSVTSETQQSGLTWEDFLELPEWRRDRPRYSRLVEVDARSVIALRPTSMSSEWCDGDTISTPVLPGFEIAVADLIPQVS